MGISRIVDVLSATHRLRGRAALSLYTTAGYPTEDDTVAVCQAFVAAGASMIELGIPYSDPIADGPVIQATNARALENGVTVARVMSLLPRIREVIGDTPLVLMGYINPVLQYGYDRFFREACALGADGFILPDLPLVEYRKDVAPLLENLDAGFIPLITSESGDSRIREIDAVARGALYVVSSHGVTGGSFSVDAERRHFLESLREARLRNSLLLGFGIRDRATFLEASQFVDGVIIASAFLKQVLERPAGESPSSVAMRFVSSILQSG